MDREEVGELIGRWLLAACLCVAIGALSSCAVLKVAGSSAAGAGIGAALGPVGMVGGAAIGGAAGSMWSENDRLSTQLEDTNNELREMRNAIITAQVTGKPIELPSHGSGFRLPFGWSLWTWLAVVVGAFATWKWKLWHYVLPVLGMMLSVPVKAMKSLARKPA